MEGKYILTYTFQNSDEENKEEFESRKQALEKAFALLDLQNFTDIKINDEKGVLLLSQDEIIDLWQKR